MAECVVASGGGHVDGVPIWAWSAAVQGVTRHLSQCVSTGVCPTSRAGAWWCVDRVGRAVASAGRGSAADVEAFVSSCVGLEEVVRRCGVGGGDAREGLLGFERDVCAVGDAAVSGRLSGVGSGDGGGRSELWLVSAGQGVDQGHGVQASALGVQKESQGEVCGLCRGLEARVSGAGEAMARAVEAVCLEGSGEQLRQEQAIGSGVDSVRERADGKVQVELGSDESVSERTLRNRQLRQDKKERKRKRKAMGCDWRLRGEGTVKQPEGFFSECSKEVRQQLRESRALMLIAANERRAADERARLEERAVGLRESEMELKALRVKQQRVLLEARDLEKEKRMYDTRVMRRTETNKVAVEKAFCSLASSGNVPSLVGGHASTVKSGSISPNSSVSEAEVRALQKSFADLKASNESLENKMRHLKLCAERKDMIGMMATVATFEPEGCEDSVGLTIPEGGVPSIWYGEGAGGYVGKDGRFHSEPEETFGYESLSF